MRYILLLSLFLITNGCNGQEKTNNPSKKDTMEYFNIDQYKDWENDDDYSSSDHHKFYKKANERVEITIYDDAITVRKKYINTPFVSIKSFYPNSMIKYSGNDFYATHIGTWQEFDSKGNLIKETDYDKTYKFSIKDLIEKIKKEYKVNLEDKQEGASAGRREKNTIFYYEVSLKSKEAPLKMDYILIDGNTGKTLFKSYYYIKGRRKNPFDEYLESLKK